MRRLKWVALVILVLLVAGLAVGDVIVKNAAEAELERRVRANVPGATDVSARISSFPFVGRLLVQSRVREVEVTVGSVPARAAGGVTLTAVDLDLHDVELDKQAALREHKARITAIGSGSLRASIAQPELARLLPPGFRVTLRPGVAEVSGPVAAGAQFVNGPSGDLEVRVAGRTVTTLALPKGVLLPCSPAVVVGDSRLDLSCAFDRVPDALVELGNRAR